MPPSLSLLMLLVLASDSLGAQSCLRSSVAATGVWLTSAAWDMSGDRLVATDVAGGRLLLFSVDGRRQPDVLRPGKGPLEFNKPTWVRGHGSGFLLQEGVSRWLRLDSEGKPAKEIYGALPTELALVHGVFVGSQIHGLGYQGQPGTPPPGLEFLRVTLEPFAVIERGEGISFESSEMAYVELLGYLVASLGDRSYALRLGPPLRIERLWPTQKLNSFPAGFAGLPELPTLPPSPAAIQELYGRLARLKMPVAIHGWEKALYLLTREPGASGATRWLLHEIDPVADRLVRTLMLPTHAAHLLVAPGERRWAIFEEGPVGSDRYNTFENLLLLPSEWFSNSNSPLDAGKPEPKCATLPSGSP